MGNAIPTTTTTDDGANLSESLDDEANLSESLDDEANLPESPKLSPRADAVFESFRHKAQLNAMSEIENIIQGVDTKKDINVSNIRTAVEEIVKRWGGDYDAKDLLRLINERIKPDQIKQFTTPELTDDQVDKIKKDMMEFAEDVPQARAAAAKLKINAEARERANDIAAGWTINPQNPGGPLDSPRGGSKKKRRTCKKLKAKQRTTTRALLKKWKKNENKENNKKIRK
jgi:hypothetical protein